MSDEPEAVRRLLEELLRRGHLVLPEDLATVVAEEAARIGASDVVVHLVDLEQATLVPVPAATSPPAAPLSVAGTVAGRAFSSTTTLRAPADGPGRQRIFVPLLDGTERLGVLAMTFAEEAITDALVASCERYAHLVAMLVVTKSAYGDAFEVVRRQQPMTIASELLWGLAPPLTFTTDGLSLAGLLEPCYDNGGDALDHAVNGRVLHLGVFDAMGHGLAAAGVAAFALAAYRHSRREGRDLLETYAAMDEAVGRQFPDDRFVTAIIARLDLDTGRVTWISAGHPPPVVLRRGRRVSTLEAPPARPIGMDVPGRPPQVATASLEPDDLLLLYTDGLTEARGPDGGLLGLDGLSEFIVREAGAGQTAPETLRRLRQALVGHERAQLRDDATALLVEWRKANGQDVVPPSVR